MGKRYAQLSLEDRCQIARLHAEGRTPTMSDAAAPRTGPERQQHRIGVAATHAPRPAATNPLGRNYNRSRRLRVDRQTTTASPRLGEGPAKPLGQPFGRGDRFTKTMSSHLDSSFF
jgi:hypothetical protein